MKLRTKFQDEDFEFGEVVDAGVFYSGDGREGFKVVAVAKAGGQHSFYYNSIKDFTDHWEDYEKPKDDYIRVIESFIHYVEEADESFDCDETVQKFVKELKAWKRLKQGGFHWNGWTLAGAHFGVDLYDGYNNDLDLLFGGEE